MISSYPAIAFNKLISQHESLWDLDDHKDLILEKALCKENIEFLRKYVESSSFFISHLKRKMIVDAIKDWRDVDQELLKDIMFGILYSDHDE